MRRLLMTLSTTALLLAVTVTPALAGYANVP